MSPKDEDVIANSEDPEQTAPLGAVSLGSDLFVRKLMIITVCLLILAFQAIYFTKLRNKIMNMLCFHSLLLSKT